MDCYVGRETDLQTGDGVLCVFHDFGTYNERLVRVEMFRGRNTVQHGGGKWCPIELDGARTRTHLLVDRSLI